MNKWSTVLDMNKYMHLYGKCSIATFHPKSTRRNEFNKSSIST